MDAHTLLGRSRAHLDLIETLSRVAPTDVEVLISGPTGVGKELYAEYIHKKSKRAAYPFVPVNCGAIPLELLENELFGHRDGAYTNARASQEGLVMEAENGTLFLDEIDALALPSQVKLLRFLQQKEFRRLGDSRIRIANVRFIAATNADLAALVEQKCFRSDLFYRLSAFPVNVLPLNSRKEDLPLLVEEFSRHYSDEYRLPKIVLSPRAFEVMLTYPWPGNVRELENCVKYLTCLQLARPVDKYDLPIVVKTAPTAQLIDHELFSQPFTSARTQLVSDFERRYVSEALRKAHGNITLAATQSGEYPKKISRLIKKHGLSTDDSPDQSTATDHQSGHGNDRTLRSV